MLNKVRSAIICALAIWPATGIGQSGAGASGSQQEIVLNAAVLPAAQGLSFSPDGHYVLLCGSHPRGAFGHDSELYIIMTHKRADRIQNIHLPRAMLGAVSYSPDGKCLLTSMLEIPPPGKSGQVSKLVFLDVESGRRLSTIEVGKHLPGLIVFSPDRKIMATSSDFLDLWDVSSYRIKKTSKVSDIELCCSCLAFSGDGTKLFGASLHDKCIVSWTIPELVKTKYRFEVSRKDQTVIALSSNAELAGSGAIKSGGRVVDVWDVQKQEHRCTIEGKGPFYSAVFSHDGRLVAVGWSSGELGVYDSRDGKLIDCFKIEHRPLDYIDSCFSPDGTRVAIVAGTTEKKTACQVILWSLPHQ